MPHHPFALLLWSIFFACTPAGNREAVPPGGRVFEGKVVAIADGDTFMVLEGTIQVRVRLEGIDCPEKGQPFGTNAKQAVSDLVFGENVRVVESSKDRNKRSIAKVYLPDGRCVNEEMLRLGMAWHFKRYSDDARWDKLEQQARRARRGLWADSDPVAPWEWRSGKR